MILGINSSRTLTTLSIAISLSSRIPSQTINIYSSRSNISRFCMLRGDSDRNTDQYYKNMIKDNPGNGLLLGNYARFLKEVKGDLAKAEEYCKRAILAKAEDGNVLSLYGELIWQISQDVTQAETYFHQAVLSYPNDRYSVYEAET
ncbi:uncharacterized protein LOC110705068 [Chenopodium quinoa]|uniref:uncharacterized protein LOC110705068 n=1 Tax=Chenopodium quinoa TaxID=63459 RepID=UPI000B785244|nr:uncharacterized protein LOC110705068 [Chenopodium quinoa]